LVFNYTVGDETGAGVFASYPISKFTRIETGFNLEKRNFEVFIDEEVIKEFPEYFSDTDKQFFNFFKKSNGFNTSFSTSFVRDTVLYSYLAQGPIHGNAARVNFEVAPPLGFKNGKGYTTLSFDYRRYKRISDGSLFALNVRGLRSSRAMGDYVIMGGDAALKAYPFGYLAGNQVVYGSAELRFPFIDAVVFPGRMALGPIRSFLFADYALAKFSSENFPIQKGASLGVGFQFAGFNYVFAWRELDKFKKQVPDFYISKGWNF
jgi:outer membrane protein assembly factor BamA